MPEFCDLLDGDRGKTGAIHPRGVPLPAGRYHAVVHVWLRGPDGRFLISLRHPAKRHGGLWETTGGAVVAGEDSRAAAVREVGEELGITLAPADGLLLRTLRREAFHDFCDVWCFAVPSLNPSGLTLQPEEVADARWAVPEEIRALDRAGLWVSTLRYYEALFQEDIPC